MRTLTCRDRRAQTLRGSHTWKLGIIAHGNCDGFCEEGWSKGARVGFFVLTRKQLTGRQELKRGTFT